MKLAAFDVESYGTLPEYALQPFRARTKDAWLTSAAFYSGDDAFDNVTHMPTVTHLRRYLAHCAATGTRIVGWNTSFDVAWLIALGLRKEVFACQWLDAMLLYRHCYNRPTFDVSDKRSYSLKAAVAEFLPEHAGYEKGVTFGASDPKSIAELLNYNMLDAQRTLDLTHIFKAKLHSNTWRAALVEAACIPMVAETMVEGIKVNVGAAQDLAEKLEATHNEMFVRLKLSEPTITPELLASPTQLRKLLYGDWNLPVHLSTPKGAASTDREALQILALVDPRAELINNYREAKGNRTKFADGSVTSVAYNGDGCTRPQFRIFGTYSGRGTYSSKQGKGKSELPTGVPLHQWKRDPEFRKLIMAPPGYTLLEFDFAGQEFRWMAVCSGDPRMLQLCMPGEDAHAFMGARIASMDYYQLMADVAAKVPGAKEKRQLGKVGNLSLQYRTSANRLMRVAAVQHKLSISAPEAMLIHKMYRDTYKLVPKYWKKRSDSIKLHGYVENLVGRRVYVGDYSTWDRSLEWSYTSTGINFPIQSMGADQKYLALMVLRAHLPKYNGKFLFELHDGMFIIVPDQHAERAAHELKVVLSNLPYKRAFDLDLPIQFPVDAKLGPSWGELKEIT